MASTAQIKFILQPEWVLRSFPKGWALEQGWHGEVLYPWEPSRGEEAESRKIGGDKRHQRRDGHLLQGLALQGDQGLQGSPRGPEEREVSYQQPGTPCLAHQDPGYKTRDSLNTSSTFD